MLLGSTVAVSVAVAGEVMLTPVVTTSATARLTLPVRSPAASALTACGAAATAIAAATSVAERYRFTRLCLLALPWGPSRGERRISRERRRCPEREGRS